LFNFIKSAFLAIASNKVRSLLTVLGIVIGVASVTTLISMGQGLKTDVSNLIQGLGTNVIAIVGGQLENGGSTNPSQLVANDILTEKDIDSIKNIPEIESVSPINFVTAKIEYNDKKIQPMVMGVDPNFLTIAQTFKLQQGKMFDTRPDNYAVVISPDIKKELFGDEDAYLKHILINGKDFLVLGIMAEPGSSSVFSSDMENIVLMPFATAVKLNNDQAKILRILAKAKNNVDVNEAKEKIKEEIFKNHNNEEDFSVMTQDDILSVFDQFLSLATALISAIAAISLLVGGIGIMNIMLVTVTERTKEIGLRKAVGATKKAILAQFLVEAIIITLLGGLIGLSVSFGIDAIVALKTPLKPEITYEVIGLALGISMLTGIIFGLWPAFLAANKDPIEALRYE